MRAIAAYLVTLLSLVVPVGVPPAAAQDAEPPNHSGQDVVYEQITADIVFNPDGTSRQETSARVRIQSPGAVQQYGVLRFAYGSANDRIESLEIRVRKPDGTVVVTPDSNVQDIASQVAQIAPMYSDSREKQVPVKALGAGDILEYRFVLKRVVPDAQGHFWHTYDFTKNAIVLDEVLRISVPANRYVKVSSPSLKAETREENGRVVHTWKSTCSQVAKPEEKAPGTPDRENPAVQLTTFRNWEEVGQWYRALEQSRLEVSPAIRAKAAELTAGLSSNAEKERAIYQFVSTKFRYISISFGVGRYQPHSADETFANQYGDCKDKHTLFAALLKAAGIEAWAALVGIGIEINDEAPSPAQFNHVITYLPQGGGASWLDTTPEVAPYGLLVQPLREQRALLVPANGAAKLLAIPATTPFPAAETLTVQSKLAPDGTLTGHFELATRGDTELLLRSAFHATPPARWQELAQNLAAAQGYGGTVRDLDVDNPSNLDAPFRYSFNYERKDYSDWPNRRITPPLPSMALRSTDDKFKPKDSVYFGAPGKYVYRASVVLPEGHSVEIPPDVNAQSELADYKSTYSVDKNTLSAERTLTVKSFKLTSAQWERYCTFAKDVEADEGRFIQLLRSEAGATRVVRDVPAAAELVRKAAQSVDGRDLSTAADILAQAERINPEQSGLWSMRAFIYGMQNQNDKALEALKKEIQFHPGNQGNYQLLAAIVHRLGRREETLAALRQWVSAAPDNADAVTQLATSLFEVKKYAEAVGPLRTALKSKPESTQLNLKLAEALLRDGRKSEGMSVVTALREKSLGAMELNNLAWCLADTNTEPTVARDLSAKAIVAYQEQLKSVTLQALSNEQLDLVQSLGAVWDTLGWAYFRLGELAPAEKYLRAAWVLVQSPVGADHLGQLYERQGRKTDAIHAYQLAIAAKSDMPDTRERLKALGAAAGDRPVQRRGMPAKPFVPVGEELSEMRTTRLPGLKVKPGTAEFFLLFSPSGVEDVRFISGDEHLKASAATLRTARYNVLFPDQGTGKVVRRGILSCSEAATPACSMVLLLPGDTTLN